MSEKLKFERSRNDVKYEVEAEMLQSGGAAYTFTPALPGRSPVILIEAELLAEYIRHMVCTSEWDDESESMVVALEGIDQMADDTAILQVPAAAVLEMALDELMESCPHCGVGSFGNDIVPQEDSPAKKAVRSKKPLLN